jgi:nicotinamide-nucleotide amidase
MNCEIVAVGTELLLGPSVDTNSAWIGERLAENGIASHFHTAVGDNPARIVDVLRIALSRSDAVIVTGGLGPTSDDVTREAIAEVMGVELNLDAKLEAELRAIFAARNREMSPSNLRQAMRPDEAVAISATRGTAPGLICPVGEKVVYALPGVPAEMKEMMQRAVLTDLRRRSGETQAIVSRFLKTWGVPESVLGEMVAPRVQALESSGNLTIAFLAHGIDGIHIRITARAQSHDEAVALLDDEESQLRQLLGQLVFAVDHQTLESVVGNLLSAHRMTLALAESVTGGLIAARLTGVPGAGDWFKGGVVSYATEVKQSVLKVPDGPVVTVSAAQAMAQGARNLLAADVGVGITGVAGPTEQENQPVGTVFVAIDTSDSVETLELHLSGDRQRIRETACITVLDALRKKLQERPLLEH